MVCLSCLCMFQLWYSNDRPLVACTKYYARVVFVVKQKPQEHSSMCRRCAHEGYLFLMEKSELADDNVIAANSCLFRC